MKRCLYNLNTLLVLVMVCIHCPIPIPTLILIPIPMKYGSRRLHSSRVRTACALTISPSMLCTRGEGGVCSRGGVPGPRGVSALGVVYLVPGGMSAPRGVYLVLGGVLQGVSALGGVPGLGVYLVWGVSAPRGAPDWEGGGCLLQGMGVYSQGGVPGPGGCLLLLRGVYFQGGLLRGCTWSQGGCTCPGTLPMNRILNTCLWKYYLAPNFVCEW